ncbi:hypothetical protein H5T87_03420 [bacterium]|nr:hypothetical protein [bacterium]
MHRALPKPEGYWYRKHIQQKPLAKRTAWNPERALLVTMVIFIVLLLVQFTLDKMLVMKTFLKNKISTEYTVLLQRKVYLQKELDELRSPLVIEQKALAENMKMADKIYYLRLSTL